MTFDQFKEYAMSEYGISGNDATDENSSTELATVESAQIVNPEVVETSSYFDAMDTDLDLLGDELAARVGQVFDTKVTSKVRREINARQAELNELIKKFTQ